MKEKKNIVGLIGFIMSIVSIFTLGLTSFLGLILSIIGVVIAKDYNDDKKSLSIAGIIISSIMLLVLISFISTSPDFGNSSSVEVNNQEQTEPMEKVKIDVIDFSNMTREDVQTWCDNNMIVCKFNEEYSDVIEKGKFIRQSSQVGTTLHQGETLVVSYSKGAQPSLSKLNALGKAKSYLRYSAFSYSGLVSQLEFEQYPHEDAVWAVDNCGADWNEQAVKKAKSYLKYSNFSHDGLVDQLEFEGFTHEQAEYGVAQCGL